MESTQATAPSGILRRGFTLIELLIVVAIIAILAAIAVPNFLQAQTRAKYSRCLSDMRTMRGAVEAYAVDNNHYSRSSWGCTPYFDKINGEPVWGTFTSAMTSPIQYISTIPEDVFAQKVGVQLTDKLYAYSSLESMYFFLNELASIPCPVPGSPGYVYGVGSRSSAMKMSRYMGAYFLWSIGPAGLQMTTTGTGDEFFLQYDPTNGTISTGRTFVSQKFSEPTYIPYVNFW